MTQVYSQAAADTRNHYNAAARHVALEDLPYIKLAGKHDDAVSMRAVVKTGFIPNMIGMKWGNGRIDWSANDAYTATIARIGQEAEAKIARPGPLHDLVAKHSWNRQDRAAWEQQLSNMVIVAMRQTPGLREYRFRDDNGFSEGKFLSNKLNDLSPDIARDMKTMSFDCVPMAITSGVIIQQVEDRVLPHRAPSGDLRHGAPYFEVGSYYKIGDGPANFHAFLISSVTGNIIESAFNPAQSSRSVYIPSVDPRYTFRDFIAGQPFIGQYNFYQARDFSGEDKVLHQRQLAIAGGHYEVLQTALYPFHYGETEAADNAALKTLRDKFSHVAQPAAPPANGISQSMAETGNQVKASVQSLKTDIETFNHQPDVDSFREAMKLIKAGRGTPEIREMAGSDYQRLKFDIDSFGKQADSTLDYLGAIKKIYASNPDATAQLTPSLTAAANALRSALQSVERYDPSGHMSTLYDGKKSRNRPDHVRIDR